MNDLTTLIMSAELYQRMIAHLRTELPREGCGLVACDAGGAVKLYPGTNTESSETRYNMDLGEVVIALDEIERCEWYLGAIYHSHPRSPAHPSATDLSYAFYPEALMVIASFEIDPPDVRAFRVDEEVREVPIVIVPS